MTFSLLDYTDKLENVEEKGSWLLADCPVCQRHKLKVNTTTGAYRCYANECSAKIIRNSVAKYTPYIKSNLRVARKAVRRFLDAEPLYIPREVLESFSAYFLRCDRKEEVDRRYYAYSAFQQTVRFVTKDDKKIVAPQYWNDREQFVSGVGSRDWLLFNEQWLQDYTIFGKYVNTYLCVTEGEKCAVSVTQQRYECLTPAGFCFSPEYIDDAIKRLASYGIRGMLYFADNDVAGERKAHMFSNACWRSGIHCTVINPAFCVPDASNGYDIDDCPFEIEDIVLMWLENNA